MCIDMHVCMLVKKCMYLFVYFFVYSCMHSCVYSRVHVCVLFVQLCMQLCSYRFCEYILLLHNFYLKTPKLLTTMFLLYSHRHYA